MGSGKGKTRRALASVHGRPLETVAFYEDKWAEFVENSELKKVPLTQYYCGEDLSFAQITRADHEKMMTEIFKDAVEVGAIVLPEPFTADNFQFCEMDFYKGEEIGVALNAHPEIIEEVCSYTWANNMPLSDHYMKKVLQWIAEGVDSLLNLH